MSINNRVFLDNENKWVVTDRKYQKVFAANESLDELQKEIKKLEVKDAVIIFVPPFNASLVPCQY